MERVEPYQQYLGGRLALDIRKLIQEISQDTQKSPSAVAFVQCFEHLGITSSRDQRPTNTEANMKRIDIYSFIFRTSIIEWAERKGHMSLEENISVGTFVKLLKGGLSKLQIEINKSPLREITSLNQNEKQLARDETISHLPALLMMSLGHTIEADVKARVLEGGTDPAFLQELINDTFGNLCRDVRACKKQPRKSQDLIGEMVFHAATTLTQMYHGIPAAKVRETMPQIAGFIEATMPYGTSMNQSSRLHQIKERLVTVFGEVGFSEEEVRKISESDMYKKEVRRFTQLEQSHPQAAWVEQSKAIQRLTVTRLARRLIDSVANEEIEWNAILALDRMYNAKPGPLQQRAQDAERPLRKVWRRVETSGHPEHQRRDTEELGRIALLEGYTDAWGGAEVLQREEMDLGAKYFVAVFPEVLPDGRVIEHVIADHPAEGHAIYAWRAENGINGAGEIVRSWQEVFSSPNRTEARYLGAIRILHSEGYERRTLEYLTDPPKALAKKHMQRVRPKE